MVLGSPLPINEPNEFTLSSFDSVKNLRVLDQCFEDRALAVARAPVHLKTQRKCPTGEDAPRGKYNEKPDQGPRLPSRPKGEIWSLRLGFWTLSRRVSYKLP